MSSPMTGVNIDLDFDELLSELSSVSQLGGLLTLETDLMWSNCCHRMLPYIIFWQQASKCSYLQSHVKGLDPRLKT